MDQAVAATKKRKSNRKKVKTKRFVDEVDTPKLGLEKSLQSSSSDDEPIAKLLDIPTKPRGKIIKDSAETAYETTYEESAPAHLTSYSEGEAAQTSNLSSDGDARTSSDSEEEVSSHEEVVSDGKGGMRKIKSARRKTKTKRPENGTPKTPSSHTPKAQPTNLGLPSTIAHIVYNALATDSSLHHISQRAKDALCNLLEEMEETYQRALEAIPSKRLIEVTKTTNPSDAKLDRLLDKFGALEQKVAELTERSATSATGQQQPSPSYAAAVKAPKSTLIVKAKNDSASPRAVLTQLQTRPYPEDIKMTKVKVLPRRIEVRCDTESNKARLQTYLKENFEEVVSVEDKRPALQKLMVLNVPSNITEQQLTNAIRSDPTGETPPRAIHSFRARKEGHWHWVFLCTRKEATLILQQGAITASFSRLRVKKYVWVHRCRRCQHINRHHTSECSSKRAYCPKCGGNHTLDSCKAEKHSCINCRTYNADLRDNKNVPEEEKVFMPTDHAADSPRCPSYQEVINGHLHST